MSSTPPTNVDTVIVGNGPSALILSYILHGHIPVYDPSKPHPDPLLDQKLSANVDLLNADIDYLTDHFSGSRFPYSTQALPVNVLLDTLIRPRGETDDAGNDTCVQWTYAPEKAVSHLVIGNTPCAGGQWVDNPVEASWDIETLSYAGMLSLPGYGYPEHYKRIEGVALPAFQRPTRRQIATYLAEYPKQVGVEDVLFCGQKLDGISRTTHGFHIASHGITCKNLVLATGIFSQLIPPRPLLQPLMTIPKETPSTAPLLVIGSGFSAADVIISAPSDRKIIHIYKWAPSTSPSPLRACHQQAYPEYAGVYRRMKLAATSATKARNRPSRPEPRRTHSSAFDLTRDWDTVYEGLPNTAIVDVQLDNDPNSATITCETSGHPPFTRRVSGLAYVVGRRGSLTYLDPSLQSEVCESSPSEANYVSGHTLRQKALNNNSTEVAENVFIIGSLTGDSLVRFAYGGCSFAAGRIVARNNTNGEGNGKSRAKQDSSGTCSSSGVSTPTTNTTGHSSTSTINNDSPVKGGGIMNGLDGHNNL